MRSRVRVALLLATALLAALVVTGLTSTTAIAPHASACEKHEKDESGCSKGDHRTVSTIDIDGMTYATLKGHAEQRGGNPRDVSGYVRGSIPFDNAITSLEGPVVCLDIRGNTAGGIVRVEKSGTPGLVGMEIPAYVFDAPPGGVDRLTFLNNFPAGFLKDCAPQPALTVTPFIRGGVTIKDGTAHTSR